MSASSPPTPAPVSKITLTTPDLPLHVAAFQKPMVLSKNHELKRKVPDFRPYKRRFKPKKFNRIRFNFENRMDDNERKEVFKDSIPWNLTVPSIEGEFKGKPDESRTHRYALVIPQENDWKFLLIDKWYSFEAPPVFKGKTTEELEFMKKENDKLFGVSGGGGGGVGKKAAGANPGDEGDEGDSNAELLDNLMQSSAATELLDDDEERGKASRQGKEEEGLFDDWDFKEEFDDDEGNEIEQDIDEVKESRLEEEEDQDSEEDEEAEKKKKEEKEEKGRLKKIYQEQMGEEDLPLEIESESEAENEEFGNEEESDEEEDKEEPSGGVTPGQDPKRTRPAEPEQPAAKKRKIEVASPVVAQSPKDLNLITEAEIAEFLRVPATMKEIQLKFQSRLQTDSRNKDILFNYLKKINYVPPKSGKS